MGSILLSVLVAFVLGTTTYAWITLSNVTRMEDFNATVSAGEGIEMSLDEINYHTIITNEVITGYLFNGYTSEGLPVAAKYPNFKYKPVTSRDGITILPYGTETLEGYIEFDLTIKAASAVTIYWDSVLLSSSAKSWEPDVAFTNAKNVELTTDSLASDYYVSDAARISVSGPLATLVYESPTSATNTVLGGNGSLPATFVDFTGRNGSVDYFAAKNDGENPVGVTQVITPSTVTGALGQVSLVTLSETGGEYFGTITVRIWIEGWDPDCFNSILASTMSTELIFKKIV
jgi:hypothetical protein